MDRTCGLLAAVLGAAPYLRVPQNGSRGTLGEAASVVYTSPTCVSTDVPFPNKLMVQSPCSKVQTAGQLSYVTGLLTMTPTCVPSKASSVAASQIQESMVVK